ncbi:MAG: DUF2029 domain-containing protein [Opitutaceae bacterium]|nr:DUF2029 domain-containing protein [Opitutaceae bacterium]
MNTVWQRARGGVLLGAMLILIFVGALTKSDLFTAIGVQPLKPLYSDLIAILAAGEAQQAGLDPYAHNPLDPYNRPHVYGPWWLVTGDLGLVRGDAWWLGSLLALVTVVTGALLLSPRSKASWCAAAALLISPPVLLALERGNNDLFVMLLLVGAAWLVTRRNWFGGMAGGGLLLIAAALKLYPLAALPALAARATSRARALGWVVVTTVACALVLLTSWATYQKVAAMAPEPLTIFGYGAKLSYYVFLTIPEERMWLTLGTVPVLGVIGGMAWRYRSALWHLVPTTGFEAAGYLAGALAWSLCYVSTISFPYRLVLLLLPARLWLKDGTSRAARLQLITAIGLLWTPCVKEHLLVLSADESQFTGAPIAWLALGGEHAVALMLTVLLVVSTMGWGWRRCVSTACDQGID